MSISTIARPLPLGFDIGMCDTPQCFLITGAIGSGKTLVAASLLSRLEIPYVSPDLYFQYLIKCQCCRDDERYDRARTLCKKRLRNLVHERRSFAWETVLASQWKWDILDQCRETHSLTILYLEVRSPQVCIERARRRAAAGWYEVHSEKILDSHHKMILARPRLQELANVFIPVDNSDDLI